MWSNEEWGEIETRNRLAPVMWALELGVLVVLQVVLIPLRMVYLLLRGKA